MICALTLGLVSLPALGEDAVTQPVKMGKLSRFPDDVRARHKLKHFSSDISEGPQGVLIGNPDRDVVYQIWGFGAVDPEFAFKTIVAERDMATLKLRRSIVIPHMVVRANASNGGELATTLDRRNQRLIMEYTGHSPDELSIDPFGLLLLDLESFTYIAKEFPRGLVRNIGKQQWLAGLEYDEEADQLIVLAGGIDNIPAGGGTANTVTLLGWRNADLQIQGPLPGPPGMLGPRLVRNCRRDPINNASSSVVRLTPIMIGKGPDLDVVSDNPPIKTWIVFPCYSTYYSSNDVLIRVSREGLFDSASREEKAIPAPTAIANWVMDTARGRMYLLNATQEVDAWVYEVKSNAFIGLIEMSPKNETSAASIALGIDERSGRLYGYSSGFGIMIAEADQDPVPQADTYPLGKPILYGQAAIVVDPKRDRILFVRGAGGEDSWLDHYEIWKVPPPLPPQEVEDPDQLTAQVQEAQGKTEREFGGVATAYGARLLMAAGLGGVIPSNGNRDVGTLFASANARCGFRSREIGIGVVPQTELSESILDARADSVRLDDNTAKDFGQPSRCDLYYQYFGPVPTTGQTMREHVFFTSFFGEVEALRSGTGVDGHLHALGLDAALEQITGIKTAKSTEEHFNDTLRPQTAWSYEPAYCTADHYPKDKPGHNSERFAGDTFVSCRKANDVGAHAEGHLSGILGSQGAALPVRIGKATSFTRVYMDPKDGIVAEATSRVEDIMIGPITIGFIENTARSVAKGRSGTAETIDYRPIMGAVRGGGITGCEFRCNIDDLLPQINNALSGRAEVRRTKPEPRLEKGSPGGYEAGIIKSDKQYASDNALTGDDSREVPALEVIVYNDNEAIGRARQLLQFAGVRATSNYGIKLINEGTPCGVECEPPPPPDVPPPAPDTKVVVVEKQLPGRTITKRVPVYVGIPGGFRLIFADARAAGAMATVWLLLLSPGIAYVRRRRLKGLG